MNTTASDDLERELKDPEFRKLYGAAEAKSELAITIANARHNLSLTQEEIAKKVGVSQPYVAKLESGEANPTFGAIGSILAILNLRLNLGITSLLPEPNIICSADNTFAWDTTFKQQWVADTNAAIMDACVEMPTYKQNRSIRQGALLPTENYDFYTTFAKIDDSSLIYVSRHSSAEVNVGGHRA